MRFPLTTTPAILEFPMLTFRASISHANTVESSLFRRPLWIFAMCCSIAPRAKSSRNDPAPVAESSDTAVVRDLKSERSSPDALIT